MIPISYAWFEKGGEKQGLMDAQVDCCDVGHGEEMVGASVSMEMDEESESGGAT